jgi:hypothetical protein
MEIVDEPNRERRRATFDQDPERYDRVRSG